MSEVTFYKKLECFCRDGLLAHLSKGLYYKLGKLRFGNVPIKEQDIVAHYVEDEGRLVVGYAMGTQLQLYDHQVQGIL